MAAADVGAVVVTREAHESDWGPCRFGDGCTRAGCRYAHPRDRGFSESHRGFDDSVGMTWIRPDGPYGNPSAAPTPGRVTLAAPAAPAAAAAAQPQLPAVGSIVEAVYEADGEWYAASVDNVVGQDVWVSFVDYDNETAVVTPSGVRALEDPPAASLPAPQMSLPPPQQQQQQQQQPQQQQQQQQRSSRATAARSPQKQAQASVLARLGTKRGEKSEHALAAPAALSRLDTQRGTTKPAKGGASGKRKSTPQEVPSKKAKTAAAPSASTSAVQQKLQTARKAETQAGARPQANTGRPVAAARAALADGAATVRVPPDASPVMRFLLKKESTGKLTASQQAELSRLRKEASEPAAPVGAAATSMSPANRTARRRPDEGITPASAPLQLDLEVRV